MNIKNFKIGDSIQYQLPLFDPQEGKITKIYTDSVVVNNTIHVSEKYIIKKINNKYYRCAKCQADIGPQTGLLREYFCDDCLLKTQKSIKISDLKIGDRVKYKDKIAYCGTTTVKEIAVEGNILEIHDKFYQISDDDNRFDGKQLSVKKENIISKLEHIILEPQYKEIPIEKEENPYWIPVTKIMNHSYTIPENKIICKYCNVKISALPGFGDAYSVCHQNECKIKEKINNLLNKISSSNSFESTKLSSEVLNLTNQLVKEEPAPKSFKFNFTKTGYDFWIPNKIMKELEIHKEYTVEITEKKQEITF